MKIITGQEFDEYWKKNLGCQEDEETEKTVKEIILAVRNEGDRAVRRFASLFDRYSPDILEVPLSKVQDAVQELDDSEPGLAKALRFSAENIRRFSLAQREQLRDFEFEIVPGVLPVKG